MTFATLYKRSMVVAVKICALYFVLGWLFSFVPAEWLYLYSLFVVISWYVIVRGLE